MLNGGSCLKVDNDDVLRRENRYYWEIRMIKVEVYKSVWFVLGLVIEFVCLEDVCGRIEENKYRDKKCNLINERYFLV